MQHIATYRDCLAGRVNAPEDATEALLFQFFMVVGMVSIMATFNGLRHSGLAFFTTHHWIYPLVACVAFCLRLLVAERIVKFVAPRMIEGRLKGIAKVLAMTTLNIMIMAPLMTTVVTALLYGTDGFAHNIVSNLLVSMPVSFTVNLLVVAPAVKLLFANVLTTERGVRWLTAVEENAMRWMYLINS